MARARRGNIREDCWESGLPAKKGLVDNRPCSLDERSWLAPVVFANRRAWLAGESGRRELVDEFFFRQETLSLTRELREDERLSRDGLGFGWQSVAREGEHEHSGSRPGDARGLGHRAPKRRHRGREIPDTVRNDEI